MTTLTQLYTVAEHGFGDCWRTAIACLLGYSSPEDVPLFTYSPEGVRNDDWWPDTWNWLRERGYDLDHWEIDESNPAPDYLYMASGLSPRKRPDGSDIHHAVVACGREILHDPHPERRGLLELRSAFTIRPIMV